MAKISSVVCTILLLCSIAKAQQPTNSDNGKGQMFLAIETVSYHIHDSYFPDAKYWDNRRLRKFNAFTPGIGFEIRLNNYFHAGAGVYRNSIYKTSGYGLIGVETNGNKPVGVGIEGGIVSGYEKSVTPTALPYLRLGSRKGRINVKLAVIPEIENVTPYVLTAQVRVKLLRLWGM